jgi:hypothetical protein
MIKSEIRKLGMDVEKCLESIPRDIRHCLNPIKYLKYILKGTWQRGEFSGVFAEISSA